MTIFSGTESTIDKKKIESKIHGIYNEALSKVSYALTKASAHLNKKKVPVYKVPIAVKPIKPYAVHDYNFDNFYSDNIFKGDFGFAGQFDGFYNHFPGSYSHYEPFYKSSKYLF